RREDRGAARPRPPLHRRRRRGDRCRAPAGAAAGDRAGATQHARGRVPAPHGKESGRLTSLMAGTLHVVEYNALIFRRIWRGSIAVSFFTPLFFLAAMGVGLGSLVNRGSGGVNGVPYLDFLAPGLIAAACMQTAAVEATYPILAKIMWEKTYDAALATPVTIADLIRGEVVWMTIRMFIVAAMFWIVMYLFG